VPFPSLAIFTALPLVLASTPFTPSNVTPLLAPAPVPLPALIPRLTAPEGGNAGGFVDLTGGCGAEREMLLRGLGNPGFFIPAKGKAFDPPTTELIALVRSSDPSLSTILPNIFACNA
jgi:hypothetical protein